MKYKIPKSLEKVILQINEVMRYFVEELKERNLPPLTDWHTYHLLAGEDTWVFLYRPKDLSDKSLSWQKIDERKKFGPITTFLTSYPAHITFTIDLKSSLSSFFPAFYTVNQLLLDLFDMGKLVNIETFKRALPEDTVIIEHATEIKAALESWLYSTNHEKATEQGKVLHAYAKYFPKPFREAPSHTLYRAIMITNVVFEKLKKGVPLVLKNRKYSSWTYDVRAAQTFGSAAMENKPSYGYGYIGIVLKRAFKPNQILLNVAEADQALELGVQVAQDEKEIIIINQSKDLIFKSKEVSAYMTGPGQPWKRLSQ